MTVSIYQSPAVKNATFIAEPGFYKIECWGARGFNANYGGCGAYVTGTIKIQKRTELYVFVGAVGEDQYNGNAFNGGGKSQRGGGGASDVRLVNGDWNDFESLKSRIIVAAGGGGFDSGPNTEIDKGGAGGELEGLPSSLNHGKGGTQTKGGNGNGNGNGVFGCGGSNNNLANSGANDSNGAGGGGYFGGGASDVIVSYGGGGGSSFISGHSGCNAISEKSSSIDDIIPTNQPIHYSGMQFFNTEMISGDQTMISLTGTSEKGHCEGGAVKITTINLIYSLYSCKRKLFNFNISPLLYVSILIS